jgi:rfaE bifunctional protein kinase chain/domain/rfaE bifunctional protein nucleotidyltransferase chain/domain
MSDPRTVPPIEAAEAAALVARLKTSPKIVVVGDVMLDRWVYGTLTRISPEAPAPVFLEERVVESPGGAANVVMKLADLGCNAVVLCVGPNPPDEPRRRLYALMECEPERLSAADDASRPTTVKTRFVADGRQLYRHDVEATGPITTADEDGLIAGLGRHVAAADALVLCDHGKGVLTPMVIRAAMHAAVARKIPVVVDPAPGRPLEVYEVGGSPRNFVFVPNAAEYEAALDWLDLGNSDWMYPTAVTDGPRGMRLLRGLGTIHSTRVDFPTRPVDPVDVTGAGDAVAATMALGLASGLSVADCCRLANNAGRAVVLQERTGTLSRAMLVTGEPTVEPAVTAPPAQPLPAGVSPGLPPPLPGESLNDYMKRMESPTLWTVAAPDLSPPQSQEVRKLLEEMRGPSPIFLPHGLVVSAVDSVKAAGVVFIHGDPEADRRFFARWREQNPGPVAVANGVFDLFHAGHARLLAHARRFGHLVVAINSDASARRLKGDYRPVIAAIDRAEVIRSIKGVDLVVIFDHDTPGSIIEALKPEVLVKGNDWRDSIHETRTLSESGRMER